LRLAQELREAWQQARGSRPKQGEVAAAILVAVAIGIIAFWWTLDLLS
jgi:hypothetical protein